MAGHLSLSESLHCSLAQRSEHSPGKNVSTKTRQHHGCADKQGRNLAKKMMMPVSTGYQVSLCAIFYASQLGVEYEGIYSLLSLQYFGLPISLISVSGIISACFSMLAIPLLGVYSDNGLRPKVRKVMVQVGALLIFLVSNIIYIVCSFIQNDKVRFELDKISTHDLNTSTPDVHREMTHSSIITMNSSDKNYPNDIHSNNINYAKVQILETTPIPLTAILGIIAVICQDIAFDISMSLPRGLIAESVAAEQTAQVFSTGTSLSGLGGVTIGVFGTLGLAKDLGDAFGMDEISATLVFLSAFHIVVCLIAFSSTFITVWILHVRNCNAEDPSEATSIIKKEACAYKLYSESSSQITLSNENSINCENDNPFCDTTKKANNTTGMKIYNSEDNFSDRLRGSYNKDKETSDILRLILPDEENQSQNFWQKFRYKLHKLKQAKSCRGYPLNRHFILTLICTFFIFGVNIMACIYTSNTLTLEVLHGDPQAPPGTEPRRRYDEGIRMASFGSLLLGLGYFVASVANRKLVDKLDAAALLTIFSLLQTGACGVFIVVQTLWSYFLMMAVVGISKGPSFCLPFVLALKFSDTDTIDDKKESNAGRVTSLVGSMMPFHFLFISAIMGPSMDALGTAWVPIWYMTVSAAFSALVSGLLLFV